MTALLDYTLRISLILSIALVVTYFVRGKSAAFRHAVLTSGVFCAAALPIFKIAFPPLIWTPPLEVATVMAPLVPSVSPFERPAPRLPEPEPATRTIVGFSPPQTPGEPKVMWPSFVVIIRFVYFAGAVVSLAALLLSLIRLARIGLTSKDVNHPTWIRVATEIAGEYGIRPSVRLRESRSPSVLATWGLLRPRVVVPAGSRQWTEERIRVVLGHELAHVRRRDWLVQLVVEVFRTVLWFNPLLWIVRRRLRQESEHACDDAVLNRGVPASE